MTESEIYTVLSEAISLMDAAFEFWISSSFAVLLAFFFARGRITGFLRSVILILYTITSVYLSLRIYVAGARTLALLDTLDSMGSPYTGTNPAIGGLTGLSLATIIAIGFFSTIYFGLNSSKLLEQDRDADT